MNLVLIGPQLPPLHFLVMKFKLHLCSRGNVYFGVKVLHIQISAPRCGRPQHKQHIHMKGLQGTKLRQSSHLYPGWSHLLSCLWAWSIRGKDKLEINLMKPRVLTSSHMAYVFILYLLINLSVIGQRPIDRYGFWYRGYVNWHHHPQLSDDTWGSSR